MMINITLFNRYINEEHNPVYQRTFLYKIKWDNARRNLGAPPSYSTLIEFPAWESLYYLPAREWRAREDKTGYWTLQVEDVILQGLHLLEIGQMSDSLYDIYSLSDLKKNFDMVTITELMFEEKPISAWTFKVGAQ